MGFSLTTLRSLRPNLYHLTSPDNLAAIVKTGELRTAAALVQGTDGESALTARRKKPARIETELGETCLRDQSPLNEASIEFVGGWTFETLLNAVNSRVFFWPGDEHGPISHGQRQMKKYRADAILRMKTSDVFRLNNEPTFCMSNSGSPRQSGGKGSPRGPETFVSAHRADFSAGKVVEVTFEKVVGLPENCEVLIQGVSGWADLRSL